MRLLLDENLSDRLLGHLASAFPESCHVKQLGLMQADDLEIWERARADGFVLVTKDRDFQQLAVLRGAPPKIVWLRVGNFTTGQVAELLRRNVAAMDRFASDPKAVLLILTDAGSRD